MFPNWLHRGISLVFTLIASAGRAEEAIDLGVDLAGSASSEFQPYVFERNELWILFPLGMLVLLTLHLLPVPRTKIRRLTLRNDFFGQPADPQKAESSVSEELKAK